MKCAYRQVLCVVLLFLAASASSAPRGGISVALVQSVPEGTELGQPGMAEAKETWIRMINAAQTSIEIEQMYVSGKNGTSDATNDVIQALESASARGVKIRLILAKNMISTDTVMLERLRNIPNLTLGVIDLGKLTGGIQHAKFWIVDGKNLFVGSQNFDYLALTQIHEVGVEIQDRVLAARLHSVFEMDWEISQTGRMPTDLGRAPSTPPGADVELVASPPSLNPENIRGALVALKGLLKMAKNTVRIQVMEYSTFAYGSSTQMWTELDDSIRAAARRGVKIEFIVSHWNTARPAIESIKSLSLEKNIELRICTVPDLPSGHTPFSRVIHSKYMIIDDSILWVGSSNWSKNYFDATRGVEMIMRRPDLAAAAARMFSTVWSAPYTVGIDVNRAYPKPIK